MSNQWSKKSHLTMFLVLFTRVGGSWFGPGDVRDTLIALVHQYVPSSKYHVARLLLFVFDSYEKHAQPAELSQIASASAASFFCRFRNGLT